MINWISQTDSNIIVIRISPTVFFRVISQFKFVLVESMTIQALNRSFWFLFLFSHQLNISNHLIHRKRTLLICSLQRYKNILKSQTETMKS
jgi:uncharacterized membrane protein YkgB